MKLIFAAGTSLFSKFIMWGLGEPVSHFAIVFDEDKYNGSGIVFQSNLVGVGIDWYENFKKSHSIVYELDYPQDLDAEEALYQQLLTTYSGDGYDYKAFLYFVWRGFLYRVFKKPYPPTNKWSVPGKYLCDALVSVLPDSILPGDKSKARIEMLSPYRVYQLIKNNGSL